MPEVDHFAKKTIVDVVSALLEEHWTPWQKIKEKVGRQEYIAGWRLTKTGQEHITLFFFINV